MLLATVVVSLDTVNVVLVPAAGIESRLSVTPEIALLTVLLALSYETPATLTIASCGFAACV